MSCIRAELYLAAWIEGTLPSHEWQQLIRHTTRCRSCARLFVIILLDACQIESGPASCSTEGADE